METSLLYLLVGLSLFGVRLLSRKHPDRIRFIAFVVVGAGMGALISAFMGPPWPSSYRVPGLLIPLITGIAATLLYAVEKIKMASRPGLHYFVTFLPGLTLCLTSILMLMGYRMLTHQNPLTPQGRNMLFLILLLVSFLIVFGYTFPLRWFKSSRE